MYFVFATGRGRRYTETIGVGLFRPYRGLVLQPEGSRTTSIVNSGSMTVPFAAFGGHGRNTRNNPRSSNSE